MPPSTKASTPAKDKDRRKSSTGGGTPRLLSTLKVTPDSLRKIIDPSSLKEESPSKPSPAPSNSLPADVDAAADAAATPNGEIASESNPGTPAASGTPSQNPMAPPVDGAKKKGVKRSAPGVNGLEPKIRGKPGPKKKPRLEDGTIDPTGRANPSTYHKLGPKANQGAINAGLRALDRSGKPCRKWAKGNFKLKTFTGVGWEIPRWTAPPKPQLDSSTQEESASTESSNKENKEGSQMKSENNSVNGADAEQRSRAPSVIAASSPAPVAVAAAS